ncbi:cobyrinate a,c-diamide synthase [Aquimarina sp. TRL1]|uniref:cobyrinate a,c-diamide synthase n=1 Tax=Aquimarina sp. (strain TRL1) TaxID=2736252 RepID=UPI001589C1E1|nr:cobyrinate a,c-diamide synthase [Aquimarina sp. TRL1]QKX07082.1 cobyrinate a,c-diamide synthase [Aquimarina sp. TRL1]
MSKAFLIAAPWSNSGKTTVTLGVSRWFSNQGYKVQAFKCGPDYIDTIHHTTASRRPAVNLDMMMMPPSHLKQVFESYSKDADVSIVEGVMGLFDGAVKDKGSSAAIAKALDIPVILIVNASAMAYTIAPILYGLKSFDPDVKIAGVIFNFVNKPTHYALLKEACESVEIPCLGYIPSNEDIKIPSRHLGLQINGSYEEVIEKAAVHVMSHLPLVSILECAKKVEVDHQEIEDTSDVKKKNYKILVAKDEVFSFTYLENIKWLEQLGTIHYFSPLQDTELPVADIIYLAGGYPELYLEQLSGNTAMLKQLREASEKGIRIIAECGGMMYLGNEIIDENGIAYPMVGIFPFRTSMKHKKLTLGYRRVLIEGIEIWGHEFHYSKVEKDEGLESIAQVFSAREIEVPAKVYNHKNVYASYIHLYWAALSESVFQCI